VTFVRGLFNDQYWYHWDIGEPWRLARKQFEYFSNPNHGFIAGDVITISSASGIADAANNMGIQPGDLIYFVRQGATSTHHAAVITKIENGDIFYTQNTPNRIDRRLSEGIGNQSVLIIRMKDGD
jgi:hypothetical protein